MCRGCRGRQPCRAGRRGGSGRGAGSRDAAGPPHRWEPSRPPGCPMPAGTPPPWGERAAAAARRAEPQSVIHLSKAGGRCETFPRDRFLHGHPREALQRGCTSRGAAGAGLHEPRLRATGGAAAPLRGQRRVSERGLSARGAHRAAQPGWGRGRGRICFHTKAKQGLELSPGWGPRWAPGLVQWQRPSGSPQRQEINQLSPFLN